MTANTVLNPGAGGDTIATDDVAGVKFQQVKLDVGGTGASLPVSNSNPVPISDAGGSLTVDGTVAVTGVATAAKQPALGTAGTASSDVITVQGIASMTALKVDGSAVAQPVTDNSGSLTVDNGGTFAVQAAQSGTWNVTNVSGTVSLPTGASTAAKQPALGTAGTASTDVITVQGIASMTKLLVTPDSVALPANQSVNVSQINGVTPLMGNGATGTGSLRVTVSSDNTAFSVNAVQSGTWTVQPGNTANTTAWLVQDVAGTGGGMSFNGFVGAASNNKTQIKGSAGTLYLISVQNLAATPVYLKVFNNTSAGVTAGTTACDFQFMIPGNTAGAGIVLDSAKGIAMGTGITVMLTAGIGTTDNTSVSANNQVVLIGYK